LQRISPHGGNNNRSTFNHPWHTNKKQGQFPHQGTQRFKPNNNPGKGKNKRKNARSPVAKPAEMAAVDEPNRKRGGVTRIRNKSTKTTARKKTGRTTP